MERRFDLSYIKWFPTPHYFVIVFQANTRKIWIFQIDQCLISPNKSINCKADNDESEENRQEVYHHLESPNSYNKEFQTYYYQNSKNKIYMKKFL